MDQRLALDGPLDHREQLDGHRATPNRQQLLQRRRVEPSRPDGFGRQQRRIAELQRSRALTGGSVVINEILYDPLLPDAEFVELFNTSTTNAFDLSGWTFNGLSYTFPGGATIAPRGYLVLAKNRTAFATVYGTGIPVFDQYDGNLQSDGETLSLLKPSMPAGTFVVVDCVRYEAVMPWAATTPGVSLQLRDPAQDNSRVANWAAGAEEVARRNRIPLLAYTNIWKFMAVSNLDGVNWTATGFADSAWPSGAGLLAYEDNVAITNLIRTRLNSPTVITNNALSGHAYYFRTKVVITNDLAGFTLNASAYLDDGAVFYLNGNEVKRVRLADGVVVTNLSMTTGQPTGGDATTPDLFTLDGSFSLGTNLIAVEVHQNHTNSSDITFGLKLTADLLGYTNSAAIATPGAVNSAYTPLAAFPTLWLNEAQADNVSGPLDNAGQRDPWIELYNPGAAALSLNGYFLSDTYTNLGKWAFPSNAVVPAGGFLLVWCDGQTNQTVAGAPHANFRLASGAGQVALSRTVNSAIQIVDYLTYTNLPSNWSYGDLPDAQPFYRGTMFHYTPGATNNGASPPLAVFINEWMADNSTTLADPADGDFEDWFEIYNPGPGPADLGGFFFTDNLTNKFQFQVPATGRYVIPAGGFLLVWADEETGQNNTNRADLHVSFKLDKDGEAIGLFAADGTTIDSVTFGPQTTNVSMGRQPDGSPGIGFIALPTPRSSNLVANTPPALAALPDRYVYAGEVLAFRAVAADAETPPQTLAFGLEPGSPGSASINPVTGDFYWASKVSDLGVHPVSIRVIDSGQPALSDTEAFQAVVVEPPQLAGLQVGPGIMSLAWFGYPGRVYRLEYAPTLAGEAWAPVGADIPGAGGEISIDINTTGPGNGFYRLRALP